jgi:hypothetical protein
LEKLVDPSDSLAPHRCAAAALPCHRCDIPLGELLHRLHPALNLVLRRTPHVALIVQVFPERPLTLPGRCNHHAVTLLLVSRLPMPHRSLSAVISLRRCPASAL